MGLREGWDAEGRVFDVSEAVRTARAWMRRRVEAGEPALSGMFTRAEVTYASPRETARSGSDREPVALFTGEAVHAYLGHLPDAAIEAMLNELAAELGAALGQERIYVAFASRTWILDAGEHARGREKSSDGARDPNSARSWWGARKAWRASDRSADRIEDVDVLEVALIVGDNGAVVCFRDRGDDGVEGATRSPLGFALRHEAAPD